MTELSPTALGAVTDHPRGIVRPSFSEQDMAALAVGEAVTGWHPPVPVIT